MKKNNSSQILFIVIILILGFITTTMADTKPSPAPAKTVKTKSKSTNSKKSKANDDKIDVVADELVSNGNSNYAEFRGNVVTTQQGSVMVSDRLQIYYSKNQEKDKAKAPKDPNKQGAIEKIIATGNVTIKMKEKTARAEKAVYTKNDDFIVLSGGSPRVLMGQNSMSGEIISVNRKTEQVFVNVVPGSGKPTEKPKERVRVTINPDDPSFK
jgi:lipopolysaccharide transport protein LptA